MARSIGMHGAGAGAEAIAINLSVETSRYRISRTAGIIATLASGLGKDGVHRMKALWQAWQGSTDSITGLFQAFQAFKSQAIAATWRDAVAALVIGAVVTYGTRGVYKIGMIRNSLAGKISTMLATGQQEDEALKGEGKRRWLGLKGPKKP